MPVRFSTRQLDFFRELLFPFPDSAYFTSRGYTYLKARTIMTRLDDVVGPMGWVAEYTRNESGVKCRLKILCPDETEGGYAWHYKEDAGGDEGMTKKVQGEQVEDTDNSEKSAHTNAFRRAAMAWGFGRELYKEGVPRWLSDLYPDAMRVTPASMPPTPAAILPVAPPAPAPPQPTELHKPAPAPGPPRQEITSRMRDVPVEPATTQPQPPTPPARQPQQQVDSRLFALPKTGKVFPWASDLQRYYETRVINGMMDEAEKLGYGKQLNSWTQEQVNVVAMTAIRRLAGLPNYKGEFDKVLADNLPCASPVPPAPAGAGAGVNIADVRKDLAAKIKALIHQQTGREATNEECKSQFLEIAPQCANCDGHTGEVPVSLNGIADLAWLYNMHKFVDEQVAYTAQQQINGGEKVPF